MIFVIVSWLSAMFSSIFGSLNGTLNGSIGSPLLSRPIQRKLVTLVNCQLIEEEGRARVVRAARSLGERIVTELIIQHQNPQQLSTNLWAAVRARGCQFLGPGMYLFWMLKKRLSSGKKWNMICKHYHCYYASVEVNQIKHVPWKAWLLNAFIF